VFKPALDDFRAALRDYPPNFRNFMRFEPAIEGHREMPTGEMPFVRAK
jgi:hypothetical protein